MVLGWSITPNNALEELCFFKANRALAYELGALLTEDTAPYLADADKTSGVAVFLSFAHAIVSSTSTHVTALHDRFSKPTPVNDPASLHHALRLWRSEYAELREAGSHSSKER